MSEEFEGDVLLTVGDDGLDIDVVDGLVMPCRNFDSAVCLSLFGGNRDDDAGRAKETWWGNLLDGTAGDEKIISRFNDVIMSLPMTGANIKKAKTAAELDLAWLVDDGYADELEVSVVATGVNDAHIYIQASKQGDNVAKGAYDFRWGK